MLTTLAKIDGTSLPLSLASGKADSAPASGDHLPGFCIDRALLSVGFFYSDDFVIIERNIKSDHATHGTLHADSGRFTWAITNSEKRMNKYLLATVFATALASSTVANATITYSYSAADLPSYPGVPAGSVVLDDFDGHIAPGVTTRSYYITFSPSLVVNDCASVGSDWTSCNSAIGTSVGAVPTGDATNFLAVAQAPTGQDGVGFFQISLPTGIKSVSFYWGSVDVWNFVQLLDAAGNSLVNGGDAIHGNDLGAGTIDGFFGSLGSRLFTFDWDPSVDHVATLQFGNYFGAAMEIDDVTAVPEPGSMGLVALATGLIGFSTRRRERAAA